MQQRSLFILGRQPGIGRAELESLYGAEHLIRIGDFAMASDLSISDITFARLGSSIRLARPLGTFKFKSPKWSDTARAGLKFIPAALDSLPTEGKIKLGISVYGFDVTPNDLLRTGLEAKKICQKAGRSVRVAPNNEATLNTAQVLHNNLTGDLGLELLFIKDGDQVQLAQTVAIQDIDAYTRRDRERPKRDAFVGMLPPKLAQTIVNLGVGILSPTQEHIVLDPFCGTGVVLQEALLMGYGAYGTDLEPRMIEYTDKNLAWLETHGLNPNPTLEVGDATTHQWAKPFTAVVGETYLGRPISTWPDPEKLQEIKGTCNVIIQKFLQNLAGQIPSGTRLCLALPAWNDPNGRIHHLTMLDQLENLGYNRISFVWANEQEMVYHRPDQLVARELLIITRK
jgi:tRNA G10  N-methylase Trm11